jgi:hypothetical protein
VNPHEHRIVDSHHRDLIRVTIQGTSGFQVNQINPSSVTLNGVHAIAHVTRKVRRNEFPFATYVFVANQLNLHPGLNNVTIAGSLLNSTTTFQSSKAVLNIPDSARISGPLHSYMGGGTIYRALSKLEARKPSTVIPPTSSTPAVSISANPAPTGLGKLKVSYSPVVSSTKTAARPATPRPVVTIPKRESVPSETSKLPTRLRHSLTDFVGQADARTHAAAAARSAATTSSGAGAL